MILVTCITNRTKNLWIDYHVKNQFWNTQETTKYLKRREQVVV